MLFSQKVYRVRAMLEELELPDNRELIQVTRGSYAWNAGLPIQIDTDLFELACQRVKTPWLSPEERLETCMAALAFSVISAGGVRPSSV